MQIAQNIYLVGDRLQSFCINKNVRSLSQLEEMIENTPEEAMHPLRIVPGQGINDRQLMRLYYRIKTRKLEDKLRIHAFDKLLQRSNKKQTHKHRVENRMITIPIKVSDNQYESWLLLDENCDEMRDHLTGQHLQAMVLIEVARQMTLAVTEVHFLPALAANSADKVSFVLNQMSTQFKSYVFPCDVKLIYNIISYKKGAANNGRFKVTVDFMQANEIKMIANMDFSMMNSKFMDEIERRQAEKTVQECLGEFHYA